MTEWTGRLGRGFESGVVATLAMSVPMALATVSGLSPAPKPFPKAVVDALLGERWPNSLRTAAALGSHLLYGATAGALFASLDRDVTLEEGIGWGVGLWAVAQVVALPLAGWGAFGRKESPAVPAMMLLLHLVYGGVLGRRLSGGEAMHPTGGEEPKAETEAART